MGKHYKVTPKLRKKKDESYQLKGLETIQMEENYMDQVQDFCLEDVDSNNYKTQSASMMKSRKSEALDQIFDPHP